MREGGGHFGDREAEAEVHRGDDEEGDEHAAKAARGEAEVPAEEVARDDCADPQGPELPDAGVAAELALLKEILSRCNVTGFYHSRRKVNCNWRGRKPEPP